MTSSILNTLPLCPSKALWKHYGKCIAVGQWHKLMNVIASALLQNVAILNIVVTRPSCCGHCRDNKHLLKTLMYLKEPTEKHLFTVQPNNVFWEVMPFSVMQHGHVWKWYLTNAQLHTFTHTHSNVPYWDWCVICPFHVSSIMSFHYRTFHWDAVLFLWQPAIISACSKKSIHTASRTLKAIKSFWTNPSRTKWKPCHTDTDRKKVWQTL